MIRVSDNDIVIKLISGNNVNFNDGKFASFCIKFEMNGFTYRIQPDEARRIINLLAVSMITEDKQVSALSVVITYIHERLMYGWGK